MNVGFLGFGEVASIFSKGLKQNGAEVYTYVEDRSTRTRKLAEKTGIKKMGSYRELAEKSDIIISAVVPSKALEAAKLIGKYSEGIYVDMNNVSPKTVNNALSMIENGKTADAAIMGSVKRRGMDVAVITSGPSADKFRELKDYGMNIKVVGSENGHASGIKLLRSAYTKGVSALLFETIYAAYKMGMDREVLGYLSETEGSYFMESAVSRIISSSFHAERRSEEMFEVVEMLTENVDPLMSRATADFFKKLRETSIKPEKRPDDYDEVFRGLQ